jgi:transposase
MSRNSRNWYVDPSMAHPGGRSSKLHKAVDEFLTGIKAGLSIEAAAAKAGVGRATIYKWQQRGRNEERGEFREFVDKLEEANGLAEATMTEKLVDAGNQNPEYLKWLLERRFTERWSLKSCQQTINVSQVAQVANNPQVITKEALERAYLADRMGPRSVRRRDCQRLRTGL